MKKTTLCFLSCALLAGSLLTACSSDEPLPAPAPAPEGVVASRSVADAEAIALALAEGRQGESRFDEQVFVDGVVALTTPGSRSGSADTLIYAVNYADNKGFALIAAPVAAEPIIGFTEQGSFDEETAAGNPAFSFYLDAAKSYAASKISIGGGGITIDPSKPVTTYQTIPPRIWVEWGRSYPEGEYCPNGDAGCTQVAMAQMMTYLEKPTSMVYTYAGRDINSESLNWSVLAQHTKSIMLGIFSSNYAGPAHIEECGADEATHKTIGRVCRQLGQLNGAVYRTTGERKTNATIEAANLTFRNLLPNNGTSAIKPFAAADYESIFNNMVLKDIVLFLEGQDSANRKHNWVCDGGERIIVTQKLALAGGGYEEVELSRKTYFRFNWGWCGSENGYFLAGVFNSEMISTTDVRGTYDQNVRYFSVQK